MDFNNVCCIVYHAFFAWFSRFEIPMVSDPEQENVKPRYLYSLVLWIICFLKKNLYFLIREPCLLKTIIFVFFRFTSSFHLVQYSSKLVIYFYNERGQVDIRTRSSAYFRHDISMLPIAT